MVRRPHALAAGCAALAALLWALAVFAHPVARLDAAALIGFTGLDGDRLHPFAEAVASFGDPGSFAVLGAALIAGALLRGRPRTAVAVAVVLLGSSVTTQVLKPLLAATRDAGWLETPVDTAAWPSGHATAAMALALGLVLVAPRRWRPYAGVAGAAFAATVGYAILVLGWHYPSDVLGGVLVATAWTLGAVGVLRPAEAPLHARALVPPSLAVGGAAVAVAAAVVLPRLGAVLAYAQEHTAFAATVPALALLALVTASATALLARQG